MLSPGPFKEMVEDLARGLKVIPINNMHGGIGFLLAFVFDSRGRVIGIFIFTVRKLDYDVHVKNIKKKLWEPIQKTLKKKSEQEDSSISHSRQTKSSRKWVAVQQRGEPLLTHQPRKMVHLRQKDQRLCDFMENSHNL
ncbi:hypothetical protein RHMOL_Rhmol09G0057500 [Rhododendron molle]|uniref:Uncharacterized protein n=1 Tax=Rhododendron molle TaxID=49168 RepID=A0ACC0MBJ5_RHOML|nr:hypothetical protein RHMOL_Rhmol09G0057500 [Rhododendron molle]